MQHEVQRTQWRHRGRRRHPENYSVGNGCPRAAFGKNAEPRVIPLQAISGVRLKPATRLGNGYLQVLVGGEEAPEPSTGTAASNIDTVMFTHKNREAFEQLSAWLETVVAANEAAGIDPSAFGVVSGGQGGRQGGRFDALAAKAQTHADQAKEKAQAAIDQRKEHVAERAATSGILFEGISHDPGRNAKVTLYTDRLERMKEAKMTSLSRAKQDVEVTPVRAISSVQAKKDGMLYTKVTAFASGNNIEFRFSHAEAQKFKDVLMQLVLQGPTSTAPAPPQVDVMEQLKKLGELRDAGILSEDEFADKKAELLGRL